MITLQDTLYQIRSLHRKRIFMMNQRKRIDLELGAFLRMELGWSKQLPKAERDAINDRALEMITIGERYIKASERAATKAKRQNLPVPAPAPLPDELGDLGDLIVTTIGNRRPCNRLEDEATHEMEKLAQNLPIGRDRRVPRRGPGPAARVPAAAPGAVR